MVLTHRLKENILAEKAESKLYYKLYTVTKTYLT